MLAALLAAVAAAALSPLQQASLLVVSGLPVEARTGGVLVQRWNRALPRPPGAIVYTDQEGGAVRTFPQLAPATDARRIRGAREAYGIGRETARELRRAGVDVDLAPVVDLPDGPLGAREFASPRDAIAFARGLLAGGIASCVKHFPGLGSLPVSTDARLYVHGIVRSADIVPYREAVRAQIPCVMVGHGIYRNLGKRRAALDRAVYAYLRRLGFDGVAITDSLGILGSSYAPLWAVQAVRAGADLVLYTSGRDAARAVRALVPLARRGELAAHVRRVLRFRALLATADRRGGGGRG
jgi:beta-N-acetylhexosaminidase